MYSRRELLWRWLVRHRAAVAVGAMALVAVAVALTFWVRAEIRDRVVREQRVAELLADDRRYQAVALAQLAANDFAAATATLATQVEALAAQNELADRRAERRAQYERVRHVSEFYTHARAASFLFADEDRVPEAIREIDAALTALGALDANGMFVPTWLTKLPLQDLVDDQRRALHEELYRQVLFVAFLHFKHGALLLEPGLIIPKSPDAAKHFRAMFDVLAQTSAIEHLLGVKPARVARSWQTIALPLLRTVGTDADAAAVGAGPLSDAATVEPSRAENAVDYWMLGAGHFALWMTRGSDVARLLQFAHPNLFDYATPLVTAERQLRTAIRIDPRLYWPHFMLGWALREKGEPGAAEIVFDVCVQLEPDNILGYGQRAQALAERAKTETDVAYRDVLQKLALADSDTTLAKAPTYPVTYWSRGDLMRYLERHDEAVAAYTRALELETNVHDKFSRRVALDQLSTYLEKLPQNEPTAALLAAIKNVLAKVK